MNREPGTGNREPGTRKAAAVAGLALLFIAAHLPFLARTLEDIDSINFALGVRDFDPTRHQPHPPGYPVFIALGKISSALIPNEASALAIWGAALGGLAAFPLMRFFWSLDRSSGGVALGATALTLACPLFWFTAVRPMSDIPGLSLAVAAQALLAAAFRRQRASVPPDRASLAASGRMIVLGSLAAALALGLRSQTGWLTLPLLGVVLLDRTGRGAAGAWLGGAIAFAGGVLVWGVPLLMASGGVTGYLGALGAQAGEDVAGVDMLATNPTPRRLAIGLLHTFVQPWAFPPLAIVVLILATAGLAAMLRRARAGLLILAAAALPYAVFHLVFQETLTVRYALPLVPPVAYLAIRGASAVAGRVMPIGAAALCVVCLALTAPAVRLYAESGSPIVRAFADVRARREGVPGPIATHHVFARALQAQPGAGARLLPAPPKHEWLELVRYWSAGGAEPIALLADPRRTDLALIDPAARQVREVYRWPFRTARFMSGVRPDQVEWQEIRVPGWFLGEGWSITPETAGVARADGRGPGRAPIVGYLLARREPAVLMIGGRNLGSRSDPAARLRLSIDGRPLESWVAPPDPGFFLRMTTLPADALAGPTRYARLEVVAEAADAASLEGRGARLPRQPQAPRPVDVGIEQFDLQPIGTVVYGFGPGWHEQEFNPALGRLWRWSGERSIVRTSPIDRDLLLRIAGESPLRYFDRSPTVIVRAGDQVLARNRPASDFEWKVTVPAAALSASQGEITLETDLTFVPAERGESGDHRRLGLRVYALEITPAGK